MSPKLRRLSGKEIIKIFIGLGFEIVNQRGSHAKLVRITSDGDRQVLTVPNSKSIGTGTIKAIYRQASRYISDDVLRPYFYG